MKQATTRWPVPGLGLGPHASGLAWVKDRVSKPAPGALDAYRAQATQALVQKRLDGLGVVCTPDMSLNDAILAATSSKGTDGGRVLLAEGTWDVGPGGLTIDRPGVQLIALSPGRARLRQTRTSSPALLTVMAENVRIEGLELGTFGAGAPCVQVRANNCTIENNTFLVGYGVVAAGTTDYLCVRNNDFSSLHNAAVVSIQGDCDDPLIIGNRTRNISAYINITSTTCYRAVIVGNSLAPTGAIYAPFGYGHVVTGNTVGQNDLAFTLADNTAAATDVSNTYIRWPVANVYGVTLKYSLYRGATPDIATGNIDLVMNSAECLAYVDAVTTTVSPGVTFTGAVSAGIATLQYTTTATGNAATLRLSVVQERNY